MKTSSVRQKRLQKERGSKVVENDKYMIAIVGDTAKSNIISFLRDITKIKFGLSTFLSHRRPICPFDNIVPLEQICQKRDASLFALGSDSKKRPNNLVLGRTYDGHLLDMVEFGVEKYKSLDCFKSGKITVGSKPAIIFSGEKFCNDDPTYERIKNLLIDMFRGVNVSNIHLSGLDHLLSFVFANDSIYIRSYRVIQSASSTASPSVDLVEIGPSVSMCVRRTRLASTDLFRKALKKPKQQIIHKTKNISKDDFGVRLGRVHMKKQNYSQLATRKSKAFKGSRKSNDAAVAKL